MDEVWGGWRAEEREKGTKGCVCGLFINNVSVHLSVHHAAIIRYYIIIKVSEPVPASDMQPKP